MELINETALRDMIKSIVKEELAKTSSTNATNEKPGTNNSFGSSQPKPTTEPAKPVSPVSSNSSDQSKKWSEPSKPSNTYNSSSIASTPPASPALNKNVMDTFTPSKPDSAPPAEDTATSDSTPAMGGVGPSPKPASSVSPSNADQISAKPISSPDNTSNSESTNPTNPTPPVAPVSPSSPTDSQTASPTPSAPSTSTNPSTGIPPNPASPATNPPASDTAQGTANPASILDMPIG